MPGHVRPEQQGGCLLHRVGHDVDAVGQVTPPGEVGQAQRRGECGKHDEVGAEGGEGELETARAHAGREHASAQGCKTPVKRNPVAPKVKHRSTQEIRAELNVEAADAAQE